jgi:hypothetical protein
MTKFRAIPSDLQSRKPAVDPEQAKAEREKRIQQLPPELRALIPNPAQVNSANLSKEREAALQGQTSDPEQAKAERDRRMQQLPPDAQRLLPDPAQVQALREKRRQQMLEQLQRMNSGAPGSPAATLTNPSAASPAVEATSPSPSPTPQ